MWSVGFWFVCRVSCPLSAGGFVAAVMSLAVECWWFRLLVRLLCSPSCGFVDLGFSSFLSGQSCASWPTGFFVSLGVVYDARDACELAHFCAEQFSMPNSIHCMLTRTVVVVRLVGYSDCRSDSFDTVSRFWDYAPSGADKSKSINRRWGVGFRWTFGVKPEA